MNDQKYKKIFTYQSFSETIKRLYAGYSDIKAALSSEDISKQFGEKLMLVSTAVNQCVHCTWYHSKSAKKSGLSDEEIQDLLALRFEKNNQEDELPGLLFAQHYAESNREPDTEKKQALIQFYGEEKAENICYYLDVIYAGNLTGNTFDVFIDRIKGDKNPTSSLLFEIVFFVISLPLMLPIILLEKKDSLKLKNISFLKWILIVVGIMIVISLFGAMINCMTDMCNWCFNFFCGGG